MQAERDSFGGKGVAKRTIVRAKGGLNKKSTNKYSFDRAPKKGGGRVKDLLRTVNLGP